MTSAVTQAITKASCNGSAAFIPYMTAGFPDDDLCLDLLLTLEDSGADVIEVGLPFSDPLADGPVIQKSSQMALEKGMTPLGALRLVARARDFIDCPIIIMSYWNPVLQMGPDNFAARARISGVDGVILPDLPPEEADDWLKAAAAYDLDTVFMIAPTTPRSRQDRIMSAGQGFVYYVSLTGVTGSDLKADQGLLTEIERLRERSPLPVAVGFGVSGPDQARELARVADGVIVGSAIIRQVLAHERPREQVSAAARLAKEISRALKEGC